MTLNSFCRAVGLSVRQVRELAAAGRLSIERDSRDCEIVDETNELNNAMMALTPSQRKAAYDLV